VGLPSVQQKEFPPVVVLDLDGVLNDHDQIMGKYPFPRPTTEDELRFLSELGWEDTEEALYFFRMFSKRLTQRFARFATEVGASVVIASSVRKHYDLESITKALRFYGVTCPILGITPFDIEPPEGFRYARRGHEIQAWLDSHPEVTKFIILDDDSDMEHLMPHLVKTKNSEGFTEEVYQRTLRYLESC